MYGSGDLGGYYGGSVSTPIQDGQTATAIEVTASAIENADFGIALLP